MSVFEIDPLSDLRWADFISRHPRAGAFHSSGWLLALHKTYGYRPFALTTSPNGKPLTDAILLCRVNSWLTGRRAVSLPFCDHCQPLADGETQQRLLEGLINLQQREKWKYLELRPLQAVQSDNGRPTVQPAERFVWHRLALSGSLDEIRLRFHKTAVRQMIRRAEREGLDYQRGTSPGLLQQFYRLMLMTRQRHQLPPPPQKWFSQLLECLRGDAVIRLATRGGVPLAAVLTLAHPRSWVYKYGCSDHRYHRLGGISLLLWKVVKEAFQAGAQELDFGRSETENRGLITFKERWGAAGKSISYYRYPEREAPSKAAPAPVMRLARQVFARMPPGVLETMGRCLYRHMG